jgi:transposase
MKNKSRPVMRERPVFSYTSKCCSVQATKTPLLKAKTMDDATDQSLGKWRCSACKKRCTCTRSRNPE